MLKDLENAALEPIEKEVTDIVSGFIDELKKQPKQLTSKRLDLPNPNKKIIQETYQLFLTAFLYGMTDASSQQLEFADDMIIASIPKPLQFDEAVAFAQQRIALNRGDFYKLSDRMRAKAWTVGRLTQLDAIQQVKDHYIRQLEGSGSGVEQFVESIKLDEALGAAGFAPGEPRYYENVYRTNVMTDYNSGRAYQFSNNQPVALEFIGIEDVRQTEICAQRSGIILPYTDPFWEENWPPLHFQCRSTVRAIYREEAEVLGMDIQEVSKQSQELVTNAAKDEAAVQSGFGKNPVRDNQFWDLAPSQQTRITQYLIQDELNEVVGETICKDFKQPKPGYVYAQTSKGGVRYPETLVDAEEFPANLAAGTALAEQRGYFVELRSADVLRANRQFDAWVNGMEKWEFKHLTSRKLRTLETDIRNASRQASYLFIHLQSPQQLTPFADALFSRSREIREAGRWLHLAVIELDEKLAEITWNDMKDKEVVHGLLTALVK